MIEKITFPKTGKGYLYTKPENPGPKPSKTDYRYTSYGFAGRRTFDQQKFDKDMSRWEEDKAYYDENKGKYTNSAAQYLIGKTFEFKPGKVNIICVYLCSLNDSLCCRLELLFQRIAL